MQCTYIYLSPLEEKLFLNVLFAMHRYVQIILKITIFNEKNLRIIFNLFTVQMCNTIFCIIIVSK